MVTSILSSLLLAGTLAMTPAPSPVRLGYAPAVAAPLTQDLTPKNGRFTISIPDGYSKPELNASTLPSEMGNIKLYLYTSTNILEGVCLVGYSDFEGITMTNDLKEKMLDGAREGALQNIGATLDDERQISIDGHPGRSILFTAEKEEQVMKGRFDYYMVGNRLYQVGYIAIAEGALSNETVQSYFGSFKLQAAQAKGKSKKKGK